MSNSPLLPEKVAQSIQVLADAVREGSASDEDLDRLDRLVREYPDAPRCLLLLLQGANVLCRWAATAPSRPSHPGAVEYSDDPRFSRRTRPAANRRACCRWCGR